MGRLPDASHLQAVRALKKAGFLIARQGKRVTMTIGERIVTIPRANPINSFTMAGIVKDAGLTIEEFRKHS
ncbi:type II toxin-antitoxin system HicA family toxin [bacterium]|nr:type II toxin-antitoxin system HicA family toxin [bacterium]